MGTDKAGKGGEKVPRWEPYSAPPDLLYLDLGGPLHGRKGRRVEAEEGRGCEEKRRGREGMSKKKRIWEGKRASANFP